MHCIIAFICDSPGDERTGWEAEIAMSDALTPPLNCWPQTAVPQRTTEPQSGYCSPACWRLHRDRRRLVTRPQRSLRRRRRVAEERRSRPDIRRHRHRRRGQRKRVPVVSGPAAGGTERRCGSRP